ncbi:MAG: hypothetical protein EBX40_07425 [Gammaproteobacteria bacterium]|nr:hypothetical protein [Gammaproteobacteria bacterium]
MRQPENPSQRIIKKLESEIVGLERDYTALLRKKWKMESEIRTQKEKIVNLEIIKESESNKRSTWKKIALVLAGAWAVFLSFFASDKK